MKSQPNKGMFARFLHSQSSSAIVLILATLTAVVWANSPWSHLYHALSHLDIGTHFAGKQYHLSLDHWVKDGLMAVFFFVVGLEIKREILIGELSSIRKAALPVMAAVGGAIFPALFYFLFNQSGPAANGWAVPMATDIAFALGLLALFGKRVPIGLKVFLTALAIVDDLLAVLVIAVFYTEQISILALIIAATLLVMLAYFIRSGVRLYSLHLALILGIWVCVFLSGIHATIAGVLIAMTIPVRGRIKPEEFLEMVKEPARLLRESRMTKDSIVKEKWQRKTLEKIYLSIENVMPIGLYLEDHLHSIQAFLILPLFALFAAGVTIDSATLAAFPSSVSFGIISGLILGKQVGIFGFSYLVIKTNLADMPAGVSWTQLWGVSLLSGIGFTMSIFISELGFSDEAMLADAKIAIFIASILAAAFGYVVLNKVLPVRLANTAATSSRKGHGLKSR
ncbi:MAG: Na+/H+ antiporter NhaA [Desulfobulbaceae bacterium]|nr:Na+/H+ antiporter NhaA [Desulfobulbaceae bacterium]